MDSRPTVDVVLPGSKIKVTIYTFLTAREDREIQKVAAAGMHLQSDPKLQSSQVHEITGLSIMDMEDLACKFLLKEAKKEDGTDIAVDTLMDAIDREDGVFLYKTINTYMGLSRHTEDSKKK